MQNLLFLNILSLFKIEKCNYVVKFLINFIHYLKKLINLTFHLDYLWILDFFLFLIFLNPLFKEQDLELVFLRVISGLFLDIGLDNMVNVIYVDIIVVDVVDWFYTIFSL